MDKKDRNILMTLQANARITNQDLAEAVHLSPSPCLQRVRKLEKAGVVGPYLAQVNLPKICRSVTVFATVTLRAHEIEAFQLLETAVAAIPEAVECHKVSGSFDYLIKFVCRDIERYHALSDELLQMGGGAIRVSSHVVLDKTKAFAGYPLERLLDEPED